MNTALAASPVRSISIGIGGVTLALRSGDGSFRRMVEDRYRDFVRSSSSPQIEFDVDLFDFSEAGSSDDHLEVRIHDGNWFLKRGDFQACCNPAAGTGRIRQSCSPYAVDSLLRIVHSLVLAKQRGFLVHASSAIRKNRAFIFSGVSGAGKTTISRLAPPDVTLLTDEISYVRRNGDNYLACGTPFAGELGRPGANASAPISDFYFLEKGPENRIEPIAAADAVRRLMRNILFFVHDPDLVAQVFQSACEFVSLVPMHRLVFVPDRRVWDIIV